MAGQDWGQFIGYMIASGVLSLIVSRLCLWLASGLGDTRRKILAAHLLTLFAVVTALSFFLSFGAQPELLRAATLAMPPQAVWLVMDLFAQRRRAATAAVSAEAEEPEAPGA